MKDVGTAYLKRPAKERLELDLQEIAVMSASKRAEPSIYSFGMWPMEMRAETAAACCDGQSVEAFRAKVDRGICPQPLCQKESLPKRHREIMNYHAALRDGLHCEWSSAWKSLEHRV